MPTPYDELPYPGSAFAQTHPDRLATLATLFGMTPAPVERCRVLELGCGDGGNLIPMAFALPESRFTGVDLATTAIARGQQLIDQVRARQHSHPKCRPDGPGLRLRRVRLHHRPRTVLLGSASGSRADSRDQQIAPRAPRRGIHQLQRLSRRPPARYHPRNDAISYPRYRGTPGEGAEGSRVTGVPGRRASGTGRL